ncbi:TetR/AcrR family transcriptional regulator [Serpentinimonas maccroryi]|uniref:TetR/AcrR family transcriptional regulator n=1 Tax=Serpentinimonas maccroryi TaxID=1458426 RepID=UPI0020341842|nr:TetR/AcrR family transcriptional regulator [Serpentinimonas maccroryi]MCM2479413.1 TetR/AcrR family transcriptional regulator [Serpentinimonas maccroryi]
MTLAPLSPHAKPTAALRPRRAPAVGTRAGRALQKGQQTRAAILDAALALAAPVGLEGLSIGAIAEVMGMSKSGVFAHFGSREELQIAVVREYHRRFERDVFYPALQQPRGLPRLRALFDLWMHQTAIEIDAGCVYISGAVEFDDRPGPVRDELVQTVKTWQDAIRRAVELAIAEGHLKPSAQPQQIAFEIHGLILALHYDARFLRNPQGLSLARQGFEHLLERHIS